MYQGPMMTPTDNNTIPFDITQKRADFDSGEHHSAKKFRVHDIPDYTPKIENSWPATPFMQSLMSDNQVSFQPNGVGPNKKYDFSVWMRWFDGMSEMASPMQQSRLRNIETRGALEMFTMFYCMGKISIEEYIAAVKKLNVVPFYAFCPFFGDITAGYSMNLLTCVETLTRQ
jgi:hypothetical protein